MKALGTYIFAGGFTLGVSKHFDVEAHFESKPGLYKKTFKANFPDIPVYEGEDDWPAFTRRRHCRFGHHLCVLRLLRRPLHHRLQVRDRHHHLRHPMNYQNQKVS